MARILVDLDGVVVDLMGAAYRAGYFDRHYPCRWNFTGCCTIKSASAVFADTTLFDVAQPIAGAVDALRRLRLNHDVALLSSPWHTNWDSAAAKFRWVDRVLGSTWVHKLILTTDKRLVPGDFLVDDKPELDGPWEHVLYPQPWNDSKLPRWHQGLADRIHAYTNTKEN